MNPWLVVLLTVIALVAIKFVVLMILSKGDFGRISLAAKSGMKIFSDEEFAGKVTELLQPLPPEPEKLDGTPLRVLNLLQREGRLLDFLMEDIGGADDQQIAAGVRDIHQKCQAALNEHLVLKPILDGEEESQVEVKKGFNPAEIQLTGNVTGEPPFKGTLQHAGWRVVEIKIAEPSEETDECVVQPAEVELP